MLPIEDLKAKTWKDKTSGNTVVESGWSWHRVSMIDKHDQSAPKRRLAQMHEQLHKRELWDRCYGELYPLLMELQDDLHIQPRSYVNEPLQAKVDQLLRLIASPK